MGRETKNRKMARELGAPDAEALIATVPSLARLLSKRQVAKIQSVLDAAVVNPVYQKQYRDAMRDSVISQSGGLELRDRAKVRRAKRILDRQIRVSRSDGHIRVDYRKMLTPQALTPRTNNPDEARYLAQVRQILDSKGVWLRLDPAWTPKGPNPRVWEFWFSLGFKGDAIETEDAIINRDELLSTTMLGAGYYRSVLTGPVQTKLKHAISRLDIQYDNGWSLHVELAKNRRDAGPGVAKISDVLGGASLPSTSIWERPHRLRMTAFNAASAGDVIKARIYIMAAALAIEYNADMLGDYLKRTIRGGDRAVTVLKVAEVAGDIAEAVLVIVGVGSGIKIIRAAGKKAMTKEARYKAINRALDDWGRRNGLGNDLQQTRFVPSGSSTTLGGRKAGHSSGMGVGNHRYP